jgi:hypothetical protein
LCVFAHNDMQVGPATMLKDMLNPGGEALPVQPVPERHLDGQVGVGDLSPARILFKRTRIRSA